MKIFERLIIYFVIISLLKFEFTSSNNLIRIYTKRTNLKCGAVVEGQGISSVKCGVECSLRWNHLCIGHNFTNSKCELCLACPTKQPTHTLWNGGQISYAMVFTDFNQHLSQGKLYSV